MHIPVLQKEVLEMLSPKPNENFIDCTIGEGGHSLAILEMIKPKGKILGIDQEIRLKKRDKRLILVEDNFANLKSIVDNYKFNNIQGILFDLGMSSWHLEESGRGFSFKRPEPLDMRFSKENPLTAEKIVNYWSKPEIERILREYGEEKKALKIAQKIVELRGTFQIKTVPQLVKITDSLGVSPQRTFQALRIAVNDELNNLKKALPQAKEVLNKGGRLAVISFHSLEDRIVKNFFKDYFQKGQLKILTKKPIIPSDEEIKNNPRSRSAKLRVVEKII
jgi:16S rRNA (cytosine1402-N4)-methyltransferase